MFNEILEFISNDIIMDLFLFFKFLGTGQRLSTWRIQSPSG